MTTAEFYAPALEVYGAAIAAHMHAADGTCSCGFVGRGRSPQRSVGLHITAAWKRADREYAAEVDRLIRR